MTTETLSQREQRLGIVTTDRAGICDRIEATQARIDALMLEYCPGEVTDSQLREWGRNQRPYKPPEPGVAEIHAALGKLTPDDRLKLMETLTWCLYCGYDDPDNACQCWNDI